MSERKAPIVAGLQTECFALIALRWNKPFPELVIAHGGDEPMRKLVAAPHIIGIAFVRHSFCSGQRNGHRHTGSASEQSSS